MNVKKTATSPSPAKLIDARIAEHPGWRGDTLRRLRALIHEAVPEVVEAWKWMGTPVWEHGGILCTGEVYKQVVKTTFAKGASLPDPRHLFNSSLEGTTRRAIDFHEGDAIDERGFVALVRAAAALNQAKGAVSSARTGRAAATGRRAPRARATAKRARRT